MKLIPLSQGQFAQVDDDIYRFLIHWKWSAKYDKHTKTYYAFRAFWVNKKCYQVLMHRFIFGQTNPKIKIDHIDHNGLNNQEHNLREGNNQQNAFNKIKHKVGTSKYKGVHWAKDRNKWHAQIMLNGKTINAGYFDKEIYAAIAYDITAIELHGSYAKTNFLK